MPIRKMVGEPYRAHQLMIGNFRVGLTIGARDRGIELSWRPLGPDLPVRPDGFFSLQFPWLPEGRNRAFFFLEADRSTMTRERFVQKLDAYQAWYEADGHTSRLGIKNFRVLTVTKSEERMRGLLVAGARALQADPQRYWFTSETRFTATVPSSILGAIWQTADENRGASSLMPSE